jgi:hypothetical protein
MADDAGMNRISLRVPAALFEQLEEKRFRLRTSFQRVGIELFTAWLQQGRDVANKPQPESIDIRGIEVETKLQHTLTEIQKLLVRVDEKIDDIRTAADAEFLREAEATVADAEALAKQNADLLDRMGKENERLANENKRLEDELRRNHGSHKVSGRKPA